MFAKSAVLSVLVLFGLGVWAMAARDDADDYPYIEYDQPAIDYAKRAPQDAIARLQQKMDRGEVHLEFDAKAGYLPSLLKQLDVNADSQMLVFAKTSFQGPKISPASPRALFFNDEVAVGLVPNSDVMEFTALDPNQGINFYTIERTKTDHPRFLRRTSECLNCHMIPNTLYVPGLLATSVFPRSDGTLRLTAVATIVDSRTPLDERWGGWYVTGKSGELQHRGNSFTPNADQPTVFDFRNNQNLMTVEGRTNTAPYPLPTSDLVALMTLEHQNRMTSLLTRLNWESRLPQNGNPAGTITPRMEFLINETAAYMLFKDEASIRDPLSGSSTFEKTFVERGPRDKKGRSLREFDLKARLFRYPLSYMIYSPAFDALPQAIRNGILQKLFNALTSPEVSGTGLSADEGQAIIEILADTKPGLPQYWQARAAR